MSDYTELVKALRWCSVDEYVPCTGCPMNEETHGTGCFNIMHRRAAAAIEALQTEVEKRGEVVRCGECIHFTQGGWCDREFDWFPVDKNDFCSMAEKMEVQE